MECKLKIKNPKLKIGILLVFIILIAFLCIGAYAQDSSLGGLDLRKPVELKELSTPLQMIVFLTFLTILPFLFIMTTSFMRTIIVLSFLRSAIGTQQVPPNPVIIGTALFLTIYTMSPVWNEVNIRALKPYTEHKISQSIALERAVVPITIFMLKQTGKKELAFFINLTKMPQPKTPNDVPIHVAIPAFMVSELTTAFKIGFVLFLPFLIIDLVVANTLLALGMMMLSPVTISMPFKILIFTLSNGWFLVLQALVQSFKY